MTIVNINCPYGDCKSPTSIIIEAIDKQTYECRKCNRKFTVKSDITVIKAGEEGW